MDADTLELARMIYGEAGGEDKDTKIMVGSTALNRLAANRPQEFGSNMNEVLNRGYYAVSQRSPMYKQALEGKFPDKKSENAFKESLAVAGALKRGTLKPKEGHFYFKQNEISKLKKNPKAFNFKAVKNHGKVGQYNVFGY